MADDDSWKDRDEGSPDAEPRSWSNDDLARAARRRSEDDESADAKPEQWDVERDETSGNLHYGSQREVDLLGEKEVEKRAFDSDETIEPDSHEAAHANTPIEPGPHRPQVTDAAEIPIPGFTTQRSGRFRGTTAEETTDTEFPASSPVPRQPLSDDANAAPTDSSATQSSPETAATTQSAAPSSGGGGPGGGPPTDLALSANRVGETAADGSLIGTVAAVDPDPGETFTYQLTNSAGGRFSIDSATGALRVANGNLIDYETATAHSVGVRVVDSTGNQLDATFTIAVTNANETPSAADISVNIAENAGTNAVIGSVTASDPDAGDTVSYAITGGNTDGAFAIDANGQITVADGTLLDHETAPSRTLTVTVTDAGGLTDTATVTIGVNDVNEAPTVADASFNIAENAGTNAVVGSVTGSDPDAGDTISYAITGGNTDGAFAIDANGQISVANGTLLDHETAPSRTLTVTVVDAGGLTDTATVTIGVTDVNEAPNVADAGFNIAENAGTNAVVGSVAASDPDAGDTVSYAITGGNTDGAFTIDANGQITVADGTLLDHETAPSRTLTVTVTDASGLTDTATVTIGVTDVNEAPTVADASFNIAENAGTNAVVGSVTASDPDAGDTVSYAITGGNTDGAFAIDANGQITVADGTLLDHETAPSRTLTVTVTDAGGLTDTATVTIGVTDVNEAPNVADASFNIAENAGTNAVVGSVSASDPDAGDTVSYAITGGNTDGAFAIDANGQITVADGTLLDHETAPSRTLTVTVTDAGGLTDTATVTIGVTDVNEAPNAADASFNIAENAGTNAVVGSITASDPDAGDTVSYAITGGNTDGAFAIDANGQITVADGTLLDHETAPSRTLTVTVTDAGGLTDTATVTIGVTDVNEAPTVADAGFNIVENAGTNAVVGSVTASDPDAGDTVSYAITGGNTDGAFAIDANGQITVADGTLLDHETAPSRTLTVTVTDAGGLTGTATVTIGVTDVNEAPTVSDAGFNIAENAGTNAVVGSVSASDPDAGDTISYAITGGNADGAFAIDANGQITVADGTLLDHETAPSRTLTVTVTDAGGLTDTATVTIGVTDVNEAPTVSDAGFNIAENAGTNAVVGSVSASDPDAGDTISYAITGGNTDGAFAIDANGQITVADGTLLDHETAPSRTLTVTVTDPGGLTDTATVTIGVTDANEAPTVADASFNIAENAGTNAVVGSVTASDPDAGDTVSYAITGGNTDGAFAIDANGQITVADGTMLDHETAPSRTLTVTVTDAGGLTDTATVTIGVTDVNEAPTVADAGFNIAENAGTNAVVGSVIASDPDAGDTISYAITGGNTDGAFAIDANGQITVADGSLLDHETAPSRTLTVTVTDAGGLTDTATVTIGVTDVNEAPTVADVGFNIAENAGTNAVVGSVIASDPDAGDTISYAITGGNTDGAFAIDASGQITVADGTLLDHETAPSRTLTVTVTDAGGLTDTATVTIGVTDVNEAPTVTDASFNIAENAGTNAVVGSVAASDPDAGDTISYAITGGNTDGAFAIDANGQITVADGTLLDHETAPSRTLTVTVTDAGGLTDTATVTIGVTDVNEAPTVADAGFNIVENAGTNAVVGSVTASDPDAGDTVSYAITGGNTDGAFAIDANGQITVADGTLLDHETAPSRTLTVTVTDAGGLTDTATVTIGVTDVNEAPTVSDASFNIAENAGTDAVVGSVTASDADVGDTVSYAITGGNADGAFAIDANGQITVADGTLLDHETAPSRTLTVTVTDAGGLTDTATVTIGVTDVNEAPTVADVGFNIAENAGTNAVVGSVAASDPDAGDTVSYAITGGNTDGAFAIDANGQITVADGTLLDHETAPSRTLTVTVTDAGGLTDTATVTIGVTDVNEAPTVADAGFNIAENAGTNAVVGSIAASDPDAGDTISYAITGGNTDGAFAIDANGQITVADGTLLDHETAPSRTLTVTVTDAGGLTDTATVTIGVTDVNEAPTVSDAGFNIAENAGTNAVVGSVVASDPDAGDTASYAITGGNTDGAFAIDANGQITVADGTLLDHETAPSRTLTVTVTDAGGLTDTATVTIGVTDVNEAPTVTDASFNIAENAGTNAVVGSVAASDPDAGDTISYAITGGNTDGAFAIDANGQITVADGTLLDHETAPSRTLTVTVTDAGGLTDTATVTIGVTDVNEAPTVADAGFNIVESAGTNAVVGSVTASDPDAGDTVSYAITGGNTDGAFAIDANGQITVADGTLLDHETAPSRTLTVTVTDAGGLTDTATVTIGVTDVNEAPTVADVGFNIAENAGTNAVVGSVTASDPDAGDTVSYAITGGNTDGAFAIDANGQITVADGTLLDHETAPARTLTVTVTDAGGLTDTATVTIGVTDVNEAPTVADAGFNIAENAGTNAVVGSVSASDPDAGDTVSYAITGGNPDGAFAIDANGQITVADGSLLDHETAPSRTLTITVTDAGGLTDTATVTIGVTDVNEAPTVADAGFNIAENAGTNAIVGSVTASDPDAGDTVSYAITGGNTDGAFAIDANGQITVADGTLLDHETAPSRTLTVTVTDAGGLTDTATVTIGVTDVNEAPTVADAGFNIAENAGTNAVVGSVVASDPDAGDTVSYAITGGNTDGAFAIDANGQITVADGTLLDHETAPSRTLTVTVTDAGGLTDTATVTIGVTDVNEAPTVSDASFNIAENVGTNAVVGSVSASDPDAGDTVSYAITGGNPDGAFAIDANGQITVADGSLLDHETAPSRTLTVTVTDAGGLTDTATVTIGVTDVNEAPTVADAGFNIAENAGTNTVVGSVTASDPDTGDTVSYAITGGNTDGAFAIDANGQITVADGTLLDHETAPSRTLTVTVTDAGGLTGTATVTIGVTDVNEAPTVSDAGFNIAENAGTNAVVGSVIASDPDAGDTVSYAITGGNTDGAFAIDANGQITVADGTLLDHETAPSRTLTVTVTDAGGLTDTATVTIGVTDVNEAPTVTDAGFNIAENAGTNAVVGSVTASDPDAGDTVSYAITGGNTDGAFAIDANGQITVADGTLLDHETAPSRTLTVTVTDAGGLTDTATVTIGVTDVNEAPTVSDASFNIAENVGTNAVVGSVSASDPDAGDTVSYDITGGNTDGAFAIDANGQITVADGTLLDHETAPSRTLTVTVTDAGGLTDTATVTIGVTDVNEAPTVADAGFNIAENAGTNAVVGSVAASDPDAGDTISYAITGGNTDGAFAIDANGQITVADGTLLDHETAPSRTLTVTVTDAGGLTDTATVTIGVTDVNEAPTVADAGFNITENAGTNAVVGSVTASDPDAGDTVSYAITGGNTDGAFAIDANGQITVADGTLLDHETAPSRTLTVTVTDAGGLTDTATVTIGVTDVNEVGTLTATDASGDEDTAIALNIQVTDLEPGATNTVTVAGVPAGASLSAGTDNGDGSWTLTPGQLGGLSITPPLHSDTDFQLTVTTTSDDGSTVVTSSPQTVNVTVDAIADAPSLTATDGAGTVNGAVPVQLSPAILALDGTPGLSVVVSNVPTGATLSAGTDNGDGTWTLASGQLNQLSITPPAGSNTDFQLSVQATAPTTADILSSGFDSNADGFSYVDDAFRGTSEPGYADGAWGAGFGESGGGLQIELGGINNTDIFGMSGGWQTSFTVASGTSNSLTFRYNMTQAAHFESDEFSQVLVSIDGTLYGAGGNDYIAQITGDGNGGSAQSTGWQTFTVDLSSLPPGNHTLAIGGYNNKKTWNNETTEILIDNVQITETSTTTVNQTIDISPDFVDLAISSALIDTDGSESLSVLLSDLPAGASLSAGTDNGDGTWTLDSSELLGLVLYPPQNYTGTFQLTVTATSTEAANGHTASTVEVIDVTVGGVNFPPTDMTLSANTVDENAADGTVVGTIATIDPDTGETFTYAFTDDAGGRFSIDTNTGQITVADGSLLDFESTTSHNVTVEVTDSGGNTYSEIFAINLNDVNEAPTASDGSVTTGEDTTIVFTLTHFGYSDPDGDALGSVEISSLPADGTLLLNGNPVAAGASVDASDISSGYLTFQPSADSDADTSFTFRVSDGTNTSASTATLSITVDAVADAPTLTLTDADGTTQQFQSTFESPGPGTSGFTPGTVDGWTAPAGYEIEYWHESSYSGNAADGDYFIELDDQSGGTFPDAGNIQRVVSTQADTPYELSFDVSPRPGFESYMDFEVRVVDVATGNTLKTLSVDWDGNTVSQLTWTEYSISFVGTGGDVRLVFDDTGALHSGGRGAFIDDIRFGQSDGVAGNQPIDLSSLISVSLTDTDGSETLGNIDLSGLPDGATLDSGGTAITIADGSAQVSPAQLTNLTMTPPDGFSGDLNLTVTASATETSNGDTASASDTLTITVVSNDEDFDASGAATNDTINGDGADNTLYGGAGDDTISGGGGADSIYGGSGDDALNGDAGNDMVFGGTGDDTIDTGAGADFAYGGEGDDLFIYQEGDGNDVIYGGAGAGWTDILALADSSGGAPTAGWTYAITEGSVVSSGSDFVQFTDDADGTVTMADGSQINFNDIERIEW